VYSPKPSYTQITGVDTLACPTGIIPCRGCGEGIDLNGRTLSRNSTITCPSSKCETVFCANGCQAPQKGKTCREAEDTEETRRVREMFKGSS
jgi:hypothetical protein